MLTSDKIIFVYRENDDDSLDIALEYQRIHQLENSQLISIPCSNNEVLSDLSSFINEVQDPIKNALSLMSREIWGIVLGYNVPGGFVGDDHVISSTSRISRLNHSFQKFQRSNIYDRRKFKFYDNYDVDEALICTRIDGYSKDFVLDWLSRSENFYRQRRLNGSFFYDPDAYQEDPQSLKYSRDLEEFESLLLNRLGIETCITPNNDEYLDEFHAKLECDSFFWGWFFDEIDESYFRPTNASRVFFYNGDFTSASTLKDEFSKKWAINALQGGYISGAGAMSDLPFNGFIRPFPFFYSLRNGSTIGEAMLFSNPLYDSPMAFLGDPLLLADFDGQDSEPSLFVQQENFDQTEPVVIKALLDDLARMAALSGNRDDKASDLLNYVQYNVSNQRIQDSAKSLSQSSSVQIRRSLANFNRELEKFILLSANRNFASRLKLNDWLEEKNIKISALNSLSFSTPVSPDNLLEEGSWFQRFELNHIENEFTFYHFILEIYDDENYSNLLIQKDSSLDQSNWSYNPLFDIRVPLQSEGLGSNFNGIGVTYESQYDEQLPRGKRYYVRIKQIYNSQEYIVSEFEDVIFS